MSVGEVKATVREGNHAAETGKATLLAASAGAREAESLARRTFEGSSHQHVEECLDNLAEGLDEVERTVRCYDDAIAHADAFVSQLG